VSWALSFFKLKKDSEKITKNSIFLFNSRNI